MRIGTTNCCGMVMNAFDCEGFTIWISACIWGVSEAATLLLDGRSPDFAEWWEYFPCVKCCWPEDCWKDGCPYIGQLPGGCGPLHLQHWTDGFSVDRLDKCFCEMACCLKPTRPSYRSCSSWSFSSWCPSLTRSSTVLTRLRSWLAR